jgi:phage terminase large subunit-like protein
MGRTRTRSRATAPEFTRDYSAILDGYVGDVLAGRIVACRWVKLACQRHLDDLERARTDPAWPYRFDPWHAGNICDFAEKLPHIEGTWTTPTIMLEPWQIFCLGVIFGWRRKTDGGRRFSKVYWEVARKNAKSTLAAIVTLYCFTCENEPAPYVFIGATTGAQAQKVFHPARMMVLKTPALREAFGIQVWAKSLTEPGGGYVQTINAKASTQDGHNSHAAVLDELHAHKDRGLYDVIDSSFGARRNPLLWCITTAGFDTTGVCYEQRTFVTKVLNRVAEADHFFGIIFTLDRSEEHQGAVESDDPLDPSCWIKANPNLGASVHLSSMESAAAEARANPAKMGDFLTKRLNVWTSARDGHINIEKWKACNGPVDLDALRDVPAWGGLDLASVSDLCSFRLIWWLDGRLKTWGRVYLPERAVEPRTKRGNVPYQRWADAGKLVITPGDVTDYAFIEKDIREALARFRVNAIGFDPYNATDLTNRLLADGAPMVQVRQGHRTLSGPMKELDRIYLSGLLDHGGDEVLTFCASNVVARKDENENIAPSKKHSLEKIDDYAALLNAVSVSLAESGEGGPSVYESEARPEGFLFL